jgi:hypothetical protein
MGIKRDKYDAIISDLVRHRANWTSARCGTISKEGQVTGKDRAMHCSHFTGRGAGNIARYDTDAISCHCATCHHYLENRPDEHSAWFASKYGEAHREIIRQKHNQVKKMHKSDKEAMRKHYETELDRVIRQRKEGAAGFIETVSFF